MLPYSVVIYMQRDLRDIDSSAQSKYCTSECDRPVVLIRAQLLLYDREDLGRPLRRVLISENA